MKFQTLHVDTGMEWRGGQKQVLLLAKTMLSYGSLCTIACPKDSSLWLHARDASIPVVDIPAGWSLKGIWIIRKQPVDLVACHTSHAHAMAICQQKSFVVHRRVDFLPSSSWKYKKPAGYVAVSQAVADIVLAAGGRNIHVVHDGVEEVSGCRLANDFDILAVGALVEHKGHQYLSQAAEGLPSYRVAIAGEGELKYPGIDYLGYRSDIPDLLASAKVFVHPSIEEGMGQVLVEAMLAKIPIVASDVGGISEVVRGHGILVPPKDPEALRQGIIKALSGGHPCLEKAYQYAKDHFSVEQMTHSTIEAYTQILRSISMESTLSQG